MKRTELTDAQKIKILRLASKVPPSSQMDIAAEVHCRTTKVGQWLREFKEDMSWEEAKAFCGDQYKHLLRLREDYVDNMLAGAAATTHSEPMVATGTVVVPAQPIRIRHGLGVVPSFIHTTLCKGPVASHVIVGEKDTEYFEAEAVSSGPIVNWKAEG